MAHLKPFSEERKVPVTYFAPAERASPQTLKESIQRVNRSPLVRAILEALGGWIAVLNEQRQVLAVNHAMLRALGVNDPAEALGLRPGEAIGCVHANDHPGGCGTSRFCGTCGAAIAMVATGRTGEPQQQECIISWERNGQRRDQSFAVRCCPLPMEGETLLLITMRDITDEKQRAMMEHTLLHDLSNTATALTWAIDELGRHAESRQEPLLERIRNAADALAQELRIQRILCRDKSGMGSPNATVVAPSQLLHRVAKLVNAHPASRDQTLVVQTLLDDRPFTTDPAILTRVLTNMVLNALEAGQPGDQVRIGAEASADSVVFHVWNQQSIPERTAWRVFQRGFTTKGDGGRGLGTHAMKLLGEQVLKGIVSFTTSECEGTTFRIRLPREVHPEAAKNAASPGHSP